jgi:hypothetical protein
MKVGVAAVVAAVFLAGASVSVSAVAESPSPYKGLSERKEEKPGAAQAETPRPPTAPPTAKAVTDPQTDKSRPVPRRRPAALEGIDAGPGQTDQCAWLGKRIIQLLLRDDAMAANDFTPFYLRFNCPEEHLAKAFGCLTANSDMIENNALAEQADQCWRDPTVRLEMKEEPSEKPASEKPAGAVSPPAGRDPS